MSSFPRTGLGESETICTSSRAGSFLADGQTIKFGSTVTSTLGTTRTACRISPNASSRNRHVTSRSSRTRVPPIATVMTAVNGGGWKGSPRAAAGASLQS